jgi:hypothetical protein
VGIVFAQAPAVVERPAAPASAPVSVPAEAPAKAPASDVRDVSDALKTIIEKHGVPGMVAAQTAGGTPAPAPPAQPSPQVFPEDIPALNDPTAYPDRPVTHGLPVDEARDSQARRAALKALCAAEREAALSPAEGCERLEREFPADGGAGAR